MTDPYETPSLPPEFRRVPKGAWPRALERVHEALAYPEAEQRFLDFYDPEGKYAGRTFVEALPVDHHDFHASDLAVLALMGVPVESALATRRFLDPGAHHLALTTALNRVDPYLDLAYADVAALQDMMQFYETVLGTLGKSPWVTASKLCARKRPRLFPVRDNVTQWWLGLDAEQSYSIEWQIYAELMRTESVTSRLQELAAAARAKRIHPDPFILRHLDVVLWTHARKLYPRT